MSFCSEIAFRLARRRVLSRRQGDAGENPATYSADAYSAWREKELRTQFEEHFGDVNLCGEDLLDFGCGEGDLSFFTALRGPRSVVALDAIPERIHRARERASRLPLKIPVEFRVADDLERIDLPDASVDTILCFDVLEHVQAYEKIIAEWQRVLRPGGRVLIWWVPWYHPYGHHLEILLPLPWAHVVFSEEALVRACEKLYDMPEFRPRPWDLDANGRKKANKWRNLHEIPDVNRLTMRRFEKILLRVGLLVESRRIVGFRSSRLVRASAWLTRLPLLREFFTSYTTWRLRRPPTT